MRLRNVKDADVKLKESKYYLENPLSYKGKWNKYFQNDKPIYIEIGMGKGQFILNMAKKYPDINFIGIEKYASVLLKAAAKAKDFELDNLVFFSFDATMILDLFEKEEISRIYLNFSDPWPKNGYKKRRLTHSNFLDKYVEILKKGEYIYLKTDNRKFFEFSIEEIANYGFYISNVSLDLHNSNYEENIMTEYEEKFKDKGPIYRLEANMRE